jgi:hypothetical protein
VRLITEDLPEALVRSLLRHNVRYVEQFLSLLRDPNSARNLASALESSVEALQTIAARVLKEHPEIEVPEPTGKTHSLGLGKEPDWKSGALVRPATSPKR